ncbi:hypothetical protein CRENBAI_013802 [Crenichthys baileyi]|uniref:Uncharacterized protein n=1 Tax=Crenichthys baileyi TaxID=28760 RepID=A0AAV9SI94_9TELE
MQRGGDILPHHSSTTLTTQLATSCQHFPHPDCPKVLDILEMGDNLRNSITKVLPNLAPSILEIVLEALQSLGVDTSDDLQFINETDLDSVLRPVQARTAGCMEANHSKQ